MPALACAAVALLSAATALATGPATGPATRPATRPAAASQTAKDGPAGSRRPLLLRKDTGALPTLSDRDRPNVFGQMLVYVVVILALGAGVVFAAKRYFPRTSNAASSKLRVVDSVHLGPRKQLHVLEVGAQRFLLASCRDSVAMISELKSSFSEVYRQQAETDATPAEMTAPENATP